MDSRLRQMLCAVAAPCVRFVNVGPTCLVVLYFAVSVNTELGYEVGPRLRELASRGHGESGGGIHAT